MPKHDAEYRYYDLSSLSSYEYANSVEDEDEDPEVRYSRYTAPGRRPVVVVTRSSNGFIWNEGDSNPFLTLSVG